MTISRRGGVSPAFLACGGYYERGELMLYAAAGSLGMMSAISSRLRRRQVEAKSPHGGLFYSCGRTPWRR